MSPYPQNFGWPQMAPSPYGYSESGAWSGEQLGGPSYLSYAATRPLERRIADRSRRTGYPVYPTIAGRRCPRGYTWRAVPLPPATAWGQRYGFSCVPIPLRATSAQMEAEAGLSLDDVLSFGGTVLDTVAGLFGYGDTSAYEAQLISQQQLIAAMQQQQAQKPTVPIWVWVGGAGLLLFLLLRK